MWQAADFAQWSGRVDTGDGKSGLRWHQVVSAPDDDKAGVCLLGFASDLGVLRNQGRPGASGGPAALRRAMSNLAVHSARPLYDAGDVFVGEDLEGAQTIYAAHVARLLRSRHFVVGLGGGHEIAWGSYQGISQWVSEFGSSPGASIGIINFDAHFDLREPTDAGTSGTPFRQIADWCEMNDTAFHYLCLGISEASNTKILFEAAKARSVQYLRDIDCTLELAVDMLDGFITRLDYLYVTICLDALPAAVAPGVSAPAALGVPLSFIIRCLHEIREFSTRRGCEWLLADIAELSPPYDAEGRTARAAARLVWELSR